MPVHREKEPIARAGRTSRTETSSVRRGERGDGDRVIITQSKPVKPAKSDGKVGRGGDEVDRRKRAADKGDGEGRKKAGGKDVTYLKDVMERRTMKRGNAKEEPPKPWKAGGGEAREREKRQRGTSRDRTRTRTLSPTEVKQLKPVKEAEDPKETPPKVVDLSALNGSDSSEEEPQEEYEDDFEDYESDFEEDDSESADAKPESASPPKMSTRQKSEIEEIKLAMRMENERTMRRLSSATAAEEIESSNRGPVDATEAFAVKAKTRGDDLLGMITLDAISYSFLDIPAVPYEAYMKMFGRKNARQVHVQTNEDDLDEETQTDAVETRNKWVQKPPDAGSGKSFRLSVEERLGVGGDEPAESEPGINVVDTVRLNEFLTHACEVLLPVLDAGKSGEVKSDGILFVDGHVPANASDWPFLTGKSVVDVRSGRRTDSMLTVHVDPTRAFGESIICVWDMHQVSRPRAVLTAPNRLTTTSLDGNLALGGLSDGTVCLWDLKESPALHHGTTDEESGWVLRSPTYTTAFGVSGHVTPVVSAQVLHESRDSFDGDFAPVQVCTLEESGTIIIWSVVQGRNAQSYSSDEDVGLAHWGKVKLVKSSSFSGISDVGGNTYVTCNALLLRHDRETEMFVADSAGSVHRVSRYGSQLKPRCYKAKDEISPAECTCLEMCPFDSNFFVAGCRDGSIRLFCRKQELALISMNGIDSEDEPQASVVTMSWLPVRPFVILVLDSLSRIHVWDLALSDMYPEVTLNLSRKRITCARLVQTTNSNDKPHFVIGTADGRIEIHRLKEEYTTRPASEVGKDMKRFLKVDLDDVLILESKVVLAMARLQRSSPNNEDSEGVEHEAIVDFLTKKYVSLDGDIESQVITALQSGIKKGFICGLRNGNYTLVGFSPDKMIARCYNSVSHGPKCTCSVYCPGKRLCCSFRLDSQSELVKRRASPVRRKPDKVKKYRRRKSATSRGCCPEDCCREGSCPEMCTRTVTFLENVSPSHTCLKCGKKTLVCGSPTP